MPRSRGVYRAVVTDAVDPLSRGRLQVSVAGTGVTKAWAEACLPPVPMALFTIPPAGSAVWVQFEDGDRTRPVWTGVAWETAQSASNTITSEVPLTVQAPTVTVSAQRVDVNAAMVDVSSVLKCDTLIATSVVAASYTPGVGNIS